MHCKFGVFTENSLCLFYLFILAYLLLLDLRLIFSRAEVLYIISLRPLPPETVFKDFRYSVVMERNELTKNIVRDLQQIAITFHIKISTIERKTK